MKGAKGGGEGEQGTGRSTSVDSSIRAEGKPAQSARQTEEAPSLHSRSARQTAEAPSLHSRGVSWTGRSFVCPGLPSLPTARSLCPSKPSRLRTIPPHPGASDGPARELIQSSGLCTSLPPGPQRCPPLCWAQVLSPFLIRTHPQERTCKLLGTEK